MKRRLRGVAIGLGLGLVACSTTEDDPVEGRYTLDDGTVVDVAADGSLEVIVDDRTLLATAPGEGPRMARFRSSPAGTLAIWEFNRFDQSAITLGHAVLSRRDGDAVVIEFESEDGEATATLRVRPDDAERTTRISLEGGWGEQGFDAVSLPIRCDEEGSFHGFGGQYHETDQRGEAFDIVVSEQGIGREPELNKTPINGDRHTSYFPMPWYLDRRGFGVLVETDHRSLWDVCTADERVARVEVEANAPLELVVLHGGSAAEVIDQLGARLGRPASPPDWAFSPWLGAQGGQEAVEAQVQALQDAGIPFSALWVQDWTGIRMNADGGFGVQYRWRPDEQLYPDLAGMIEGLHAQDIKFLGYANPFIDPQLEHFPELEAAGLLIKNAEGDDYRHPAPNIFSSHADLSVPEARDYVRNELRNMVEIYGMDGWMADFGEWLPLDAVYADGRDPMVGHNRYPIDWHTINREVMDETRPDGDWVLFARSGWAGVHAVSQIHWIGDQEALWTEADGLPTVVPAMLNLGLSGVPYVTHDIGGFSGGPRTKELWLRWTELGAFTTFMRTHEGNKKLENWQWDDDLETQEHFRRFALVHEALAPDFRALAAESAETSMPILRHLGLVFPEDEDSWSIHDQYMIGEALLVAPVVEEGATSRDVYLPPGETWFHVWTGDGYEGGDYVTVDAPIGSPPVFSRGEDRADLRAIE